MKNTKRAFNNNSTTTHVGGGKVNNNPTCVVHNLVHLHLLLRRRRLTDSSLNSFSLRASCRQISFSRVYSRMRVEMLSGSLV